MIQITNQLIERALVANARIEGITPEELLMPSLLDITNGRHLRGNCREPLSDSYVAWLEAQADAAEAGRAAKLQQDIGA